MIEYPVGNLNSGVEMMKRSEILIILAAAFVMLMILAAGAHPQLSLDEQDAIVEAVVQTLSPENMKAEIAAQVEADIIAKLEAGGYLGVAAALKIPLSGSSAPAPAVQETPVPEASSDGQPAAAASPTPLPAAERVIDNIADYADGAVLQPDGTYRGLHAKQLSAISYIVGGDSNGQRTFQNEYTPNVWFNVDVVFENDGSVIWPPRIEMRHTGNVGEYTGTESVVSDRSMNPVKPGDRCSFTISAYGSENLGYTTFYFQLFDADSGSPIEGGYGSFSYTAI